MFRNTNEITRSKKWIDSNGRKSVQFCLQICRFSRSKTFLLLLSIPSPRCFNRLSTTYTRKKLDGFSRRHETRGGGEKSKRSTTRLKRKSPPIERCPPEYLQVGMLKYRRGGAASAALFGRDVDVWARRKLYPDVGTFNGRCVTYREETPHSDVEAASSIQLAPSLPQFLSRRNQVRGNPWSLPQETVVRFTSKATGLQHPILLLLLSLSLFLSGLAFLVIFYTWLSLVFEGISVQRRCRSFRRFLCSYRGGYTPFPLVH